MAGPEQDGKLLLCTKFLGVGHTNTQGREGSEEQLERSVEWDKETWKNTYLQFMKARGHTNVNSAMLTISLYQP